MSAVAHGDRSGRRPFTVERLAELYDAAPRDTYWRHDVDISPGSALALAEWEMRREVHATYYLMSTSPFYNAQESLVLLLELEKLGHRIGTHLDMRYTTSQHLALMVGAVSFHCPTDEYLWQDFGFESAYAECWEGHYISDSRGRFQHGDPEDRFPYDDGWQVNLHPEWWFPPNWDELKAKVSPERVTSFFGGWRCPELV